MICNWGDGNGGPGPARAYDANGQEIRDPVRWMDTETGEIRVATAYHCDGEMMTVTERRPAPILVVFGESCPRHLRLPWRKLSDPPKEWIPLFDPSEERMAEPSKAITDGPGTSPGR